VVSCQPGDREPAQPETVEPLALGSSAATRHNILLIVIDTLRADHLGLYGYTRDTSPNIDAFGGDAAVFERAISTAPWTKPAMASIFTSLLPREHGVTDWDRNLPSEPTTLTRHLKANGYRTLAYISHDAFNREFNNFHIGFDVFDTSLIPSVNVARRKAVQGKRPTGGTKQATSRELTDLALQGLHETAEQPFFMWVHYLDPHPPLLRHEQFDFGPGAVGHYDSEIAYTDHHIGRLLEGLRAKGKLEETVVVIVSDHGEEFQDHGSRGHTKTLYDELIRALLVIRVPGFEPQRLPEVVSIIDIAPTLLELVGVPIPDDFGGRPFPIDGTRFDPAGDRPAFSDTRRSADKRAVVFGDWKLIEDRKTGAREVYRIGTDPGERLDLKDQHPEALATLEALLKKMEETEEVEIAPETMSPEMIESLKSLGYIE